MSKSILDTKSIQLQNIQTFQNQLYTTKINFVSSKSGSKHTRVFGSALIKIDFKRIDSIKLIRAKFELNVKQTMLRNIHVKVS